MVMPNTDGPIDPKNAAGHSEACKPTTVPPPSAASPELSPRPQRRTFSAAVKLRILAETSRGSRILRLSLASSDYSCSSRQSHGSPGSRPFGIQTPNTLR